MDEKAKIRTYIKSKKADVDDKLKLLATESVFKTLTDSHAWQQSQNVLLYYSLPDELQTVDFLNSITDKELYLPRVNGDKLDIVPFNRKNLTTGAFNILEPGGISVSPTTIDLIVVPGIAFDKEGNRCGRGKGFYDRLLSECSATKVGVGYDFQLIENVPCCEHDVKMDIVITPSHYIVTSQK